VSSQFTGARRERRLEYPVACPPCAVASLFRRSVPCGVAGGAVHHEAVALSGRLWRVLVAVLACWGGALGAQAGGAPAPAPDSMVVATPPDTGPRSVRGRVVRPGGGDVVAVPGIWVTLHRVGSDTAGPVDSMRTNSGGEYSFRYRATGSAQAVYFVSAQYSGIAYFSAPLVQPRVTGDDAEVTVFDTTSGPVPLHVRGRHIVVSSPGADGLREIVEVYELSNDSIVTLVSTDDSRPTWSAVIPSTARDFQLTQGDISPSSIHAETGRVVSVAPFAPGLKQISFAYRLSEDAFPLDVPVADSVPVLEVLMEEPGAKVKGAGLSAVTPVTIERRTFNRFLAQDVQRNAVVTIEAPAAGAAELNTRYLMGMAAAVALVMLASLAFTLSHRRRASGVAASAVAGAPGDEAESLARSIAELDAEFERNCDATTEERASHEAQRNVLKRRIAAELDARRGRA
jgi:hypothetical protein